MPPYKVDVTVEVAKLKENPDLPEIVQILSVIRPKWLPGNIRAKRFTDGICNVLYGYYEDGKFTEDVVLFRIDGEGTDLMLDKQQEKEYMQRLHAAGFCPPIYTIFNNGIAYGYVQGETLDVNSMRTEPIRKLIAEEMCRLHAARFDNPPPGYEQQWKKYTFLLMRLSPDGFPDDPDKHKRYTQIIRPKHVLEKEQQELWDHLEALNSPIVFCHNDLLPKNIIYNEEEGSIHFIDYEIAMYNHEHYDIGTHFCEYAGIDVMDFSRYPDKAYQLNWIRHYLECQAQLNGHTPESVTDRDIEECYVKTNKFALASHFFDGIWGLVQAKHSKLDFDFLQYSSRKLGEYFARKEETFALQVPE